MNKVPGWPCGGAQSTEQNCALKGYGWRDCWESTGRGHPLPSLRASSVRSAQWRLSSSCDSRAGKKSEWDKERKEEWLGRNEAFWPEELTGAKSGPFLELWKWWSNLNEMAWWSSAWAICSSSLLSFALRRWVKETWWAQHASRKAWYLWAFPIVDQPKHP